jgi:hypothetical protein
MSLHLVDGLLGSQPLMNDAMNHSREELATYIIHTHTHTHTYILHICMYIYIYIFNIISRNTIFTYTIDNIFYMYIFIYIYNII